MRAYEEEEMERLQEKEIKKEIIEEEKKSENTSEEELRALRAEALKSIRPGEILEIDIDSPDETAKDATTTTTNCNNINNNNKNNSEVPIHDARRLRT